MNNSTTAGASGVNAQNYAQAGYPGYGTQNAYQQPYSQHQPSPSQATVQQPGAANQLPSQYGAHHSYQQNQYSTNQATSQASANQVHPQNQGYSQSNQAYTSKASSIGGTQSTSTPTTYSQTQNATGYPGYGSNQVNQPGSNYSTGYGQYI